MVWHGWRCFCFETKIGDLETHNVYEKSYSYYDDLNPVHNNQGIEKNCQLNNPKFKVLCQSAVKIAVKMFAIRKRKSLVDVQHLRLT